MKKIITMNRNILRWNLFSPAGQAPRCIVTKCSRNAANSCYCITNRRAGDAQRRAIVYVGTDITVLSAWTQTSRKKVGEISHL